MGILRNCITANWLNHLDIKENVLSPIEKIEFQFMLEGVLSVFRSDAVVSDENLLRELVSSPLMESIQKIIRKIQEGHRLVNDKQPASYRYPSFAWWARA